jgi:cell fate (sporulation/competence/biofilm development) regulator YlbF (YheA/YmcA/DUF963 family)
MGIADMFGFGKKAPFRAPREVADIRNKIAAELRENYPNLARYRVIKNEVEWVVQQMNDLIAEKEYSAEAMSIRDELQKRIDDLTAKIKKNTSESAPEGGQDYVEKNIDYLERKSIRNKAKTLFTVFLEAQEAFTEYCREGRRDQVIEVGRVTDKIIDTVAELSSKFFKKYGQDKEIQGMQEKVLAKISELNDSFKENSGRLEQQGLKTAVDANVQKILLGVGRALS